MSNFEIEIHDLEGVPDAALVALNGSIDAYTSSSFRMQIERLRARGTERFAVDLDQVSYVNSTGIAYIISLSDEGSPEQLSLVLIRPQPRVKQLFDMMKLGSLLTICATIEEAADLMKSGAAKKQ